MVHPLLQSSIVLHNGVRLLCTASNLQESSRVLHSLPPSMSYVVLRVGYEVIEYQRLPLISKPFSEVPHYEYRQGYGVAAL